MGILVMSRSWVTGTVMGSTLQGCSGSPTPSHICATPTARGSPTSDSSSAIPPTSPLAGDFDGDGCESLSLYRPSEQRFYIINALGANNGGLGPADFSFQFGNPGDKPFVGDFDGDGIDEVGLHRESTGFVYYRDRFVAGDWGIVDGTDTPGLFRPGNTTFYFRHSNSQGFADSQFVCGQPSWLPVAGVFGLD